MTSRGGGTTQRAMPRKSSTSASRMPALSVSRGGDRSFPRRAPAGYCLIVSEDNVRVVREIYEAFSRGDRAAVLSRADPAIRCYDRPARPDPSVYEGHEGLARFMDTDREVFDEVSYVPRDFIDAGPYVVVPITQSGKGRHSAAKVDERIVNVWRLRGGRCVELRVYSTTAEALDAVGRGS
jgi:ketosteroid isomerase-like protein